MNPANREFILTPEEQGIENAAEQTVSVGPEKRNRIKTILGTARKSRVIQSQPWDGR